ncbi:MAG: molybdopterin molybdotransferase MoeA [Desulfurococcaceae archaeon]
MRERDFFKGFISVDEAVRLIAEQLSSTVVNLDVEKVDLVNAVNRVLAEDIYAVHDRPRENISAVDGYAVRSVDTTGASHYSPVELIVRGSSKASGKSGLCLEPGEAARVRTGTPVPCGADAVLMDEDVQVNGDRVLAHKVASPGMNIILKSEDFKRGDCIAQKGALIGPALVAPIAANGVKYVKVFRKIKVNVLAVGDELLEPGDELAEGKEYNSSAYIIQSALVKDNVFEPMYSGIVADDASEIEEALLKGFSRGADLAITVGGTGLGESDVTIQLMKNRGRLVFRGVKMRPGRRTSLSLLGSRVVLSCSGFPVAAWAGYELLLRPAVSRWLDVRGLERAYIYAVLTRRVPNVVGYKSIVRATLKDTGGDLHVEPYMLRGSGSLSSLLYSNGYILIPENVEGFEKGSKIPVYLYD